MSGFIEGENRFQSTLFPERMDDYVEQDSVVRVIDVFIDRLDISGLGFKAEAADTGRPGFYARTMLKIYVYGSLNEVHSSRRLEREAIRLVSREFVMLCCKLNLLVDTLSIDGSKFKAVNNRDKNFTKAKMKRRITEVEASIERYLHQLDDADDQALPEDTRPIQEKIAASDQARASFYTASATSGTRRSQVKLTSQQSRNCYPELKVVKLRTA